MHGESPDSLLFFIAEDDHAMSSAMTTCMALGWPDASIRIFDSAKELMSSILETHPDLVLLDLGLIDGDATSAIPKIRSLSSAAIIVVSAAGSLSDKSILRCLLDGADDYLPKPFDLVMLNARVKSVLRRTAKSSIPTGRADIATADTKIEFKTGLVIHEGAEVTLSETELRLLGVLADGDGRLVTYGKIRAEVWGSKNVSNSALKMSIHRLRKKIGDIHSERPLIRGHRSIGYRLVIDQASSSESRLDLPATT